MYERLDAANDKACIQEHDCKCTYTQLQNEEKTARTKKETKNVLRVFLVDCSRKLMTPSISLKFPLTGMQKKNNYWRSINHQIS